MTGNQREATTTLVACALLAVVVNAILIVRFGAIGAAAGTATVLFGRSLVLSVLVRRRLGIHAAAFGI
jgi:O-antigen/teichoic acid export membrane protein